MTQFDKQRLEQIFYERADDLEIELSDFVDNPHLKELIRIPVPLNDFSYLSKNDEEELQKSLDTAQQLVDFLSKYDKDYDGRSYVSWNKAPKDVRTLVESGLIGRKKLYTWFADLLDNAYRAHRNLYNELEKKHVKRPGYSSLRDIAPYMPAGVLDLIRARNCFPLLLWSDVIGAYRAYKEMQEKNYTFIVSPYALDLMHLGCNGFDKTCYRIGGEFNHAPLTLATIEDTVSCWLENSEGLIVARCWAIFNKDCFVTYNRYFENHIHSTLFRIGVESFASLHNFTFEFRNSDSTVYDGDEVYVNQKYSSDRLDHFNGQWYVKQGLNSDYTIHLEPGCHLNKEDCICDNCGNRCWEDEIVFIRRIEEYWCDHCNENYAVWSEYECANIPIDGSVEVHAADWTDYVYKTSIETDGDFVVPVGYDEYWFKDDLVYVEDLDKYYLEQDAKYNPNLVYDEYSDQYYSKEYYNEHVNVKEEV